MFQRLSNHGIRINPAKCLFGVSSLEFLGHHISSEGIRPLDSKVDAIRQFPRPSTARQLREFVGLINFYHRFIPHCANVIQPLNALIAKAQPNQRLSWDWWRNNRIPEDQRDPCTCAYQLIICPSEHRKVPWERMQVTYIFSRTVFGSHNIRTPNSWQETGICPQMRVTMIWSMYIHTYVCP